MLINKDKSNYLSQFGWNLERKVVLPDYIDPKNTPEIVVSVIQNLHGLTLRQKSESGNERYFGVDDAYIIDFEEDMQEELEGTVLENLKFYPLGHSIELPGLFVLDEYGRFYLSGSGMIYYGNTLGEFLDVVIFKCRSGLEIQDNGQTFFCYNNQYTDHDFDPEKGWLGDPYYLSLEYVKTLDK